MLGLIRCQPLKSAFHCVVHIAAAEGRGYERGRTVIPVVVVEWEQEVVLPPRIDLGLWELIDLPEKLPEL